MRDLRFHLHCWWHASSLYSCYQAAAVDEHLVLPQLDKVLVNLRKDQELLLSCIWEHRCMVKMAPLQQLVKLVSAWLLRWCCREP